jgi:hypothetical protein
MSIPLFTGGRRNAMWVHVHLSRESSAAAVERILGVVDERMRVSGNVDAILHAHETGKKSFTDVSPAI